MDSLYEDRVFMAIVSVVMKTIYCSRYVTSEYLNSSVEPSEGLVGLKEICNHYKAQKLNARWLD
jgi:hypothetical protein